MLRIKTLLKLTENYPSPPPKADQPLKTLEKREEKRREERDLLMYHDPDMPEKWGYNSRY